MRKTSASNRQIEDGDFCRVIGGSHLGKEGVVQDKNTSKTGAVTITVQQTDGIRFKTLAKNVEITQKRLSK